MQLQSRSAGSPRPYLIELNQQTWEFREPFQNRVPLEALKISASDRGLSKRQRGLAPNRRADGATGAAAYLPSPVLISPEKQAHVEPSVAGSCFTSCGRHHDQAAVFSQLNDRLTILGADQGELLGCEPRLRRKPQRRKAIGARGDLRCGREGHHPSIVNRFNVGYISAE